MQLVQAYTSYAAKWRPSGSIEFVLAAEMTLAIMGEGRKGIGVGGGGGLSSDAMRCDAMLWGRAACGWEGGSCGFEKALP